MSRISAAAGQSANPSAHPVAKSPAHINLLLAPDVDEAQPDRRGGLNRGQDERRHAHEKLREPVGVGKRIGERVAIGAQRFLPSTTRSEPAGDHQGAEPAVPPTRRPAVRTPRRQDGADARSDAILPQLPVYDPRVIFSKRLTRGQRIPGFPVRPRTSGSRRRPSAAV
jgi:hypothetical protein